ncbi:MAG: hypothetical protein AAF098_18405 [Pseudomonadota bacterium]
MFEPFSYEPISEDVLGDNAFSTREDAQLSHDGRILALLGGQVVNTRGPGNPDFMFLVRARVFRFNDISREWDAAGANTNTRGDLRLENSSASFALSADGSILALGGPGNQEPNNLAQVAGGRVKVFRNNDVNATSFGNYAQLGSDIDCDFGANSRTGRDVALS